MASGTSLVTVTAVIEQPSLVDQEVVFSFVSGKHERATIIAEYDDRYVVRSNMGSLMVVFISNIETMEIM